MAGSGTVGERGGVRGLGPVGQEEQRIMVARSMLR